MTTKPSDMKQRTLDAAQLAADTIATLTGSSGNTRGVARALASLVAVAIDERPGAEQRGHKSKGPRYCDEHGGCGFRSDCLDCDLLERAPVATEENSRICAACGRALNANSQRYWRNVDGAPCCVGVCCVGLRDEDKIRAFRSAPVAAPPAQPVPYYLIERNDRGRPEWSKWEWHPRLDWVTDVHDADRYAFATEAERTARDYRDTTGLMLTVTEHLDVPASAQYAPLPVFQRTAEQLAAKYPGEPAQPVAAEPAYRADIALLRQAAERCRDAKPDGHELLDALRHLQGCFGWQTVLALLSKLDAAESKLDAIEEAELEAVPVAGEATTQEVPAERYGSSYWMSVEQKMRLARDEARRERDAALAQVEQLTRQIAAHEEICSGADDDKPGEVDRLNPYKRSWVKQEIPTDPLASFIRGIRYYAGMLEDDDNWSHGLGHIEELCVEFDRAIQARSGSSYVSPREAVTAANALLEQERAHSAALRAEISANAEMVAAAESLVQSRARHQKETNDLISAATEQSDIIKQLERELAQAVAHHEDLKSTPEAEQLRAELAASEVRTANAILGRDAVRQSIEQLVRERDEANERSARLENAIIEVLADIKDHRVCGSSDSVALKAAVQQLERAWAAPVATGERPIVVGSTWRGNDGPGIERLVKHVLSTAVITAANGAEITWDTGLFRKGNTWLSDPPTPATGGEGEP